MSSRKNHVNFSFFLLRWIPFKFQPLWNVRPDASSQALFYRWTCFSTCQNPFSVMTKSARRIPFCTWCTRLLYCQVFQKQGTSLSPPSCTLYLLRDWDTSSTLDWEYLTLVFLPFCFNKGLGIQSSHIRTHKSVCFYFYCHSQLNEVQSSRIYRLNECVVWFLVIDLLVTSPSLLSVSNLLT